jgi:hypothetical protein
VNGEVQPEMPRALVARFMLIDWQTTDAGKEYAVKAGIAQMDESCWLEFETVEKVILLG